MWNEQNKTPFFETEFQTANKGREARVSKLLNPYILRCGPALRDQHHPDLSKKSYAFLISRPSSKLKREVKSDLFPCGNNDCRRYQFVQILFSAFNF